MQGKVLQPQANKSSQHGWPSSVQHPTRHVPTYFDDFKYGFPANGLSSVSHKWWGSNNTEHGEKTEAAKSTANEKEKQDSCMSMVKPSRCMEIYEQIDSNVMDSVITTEASASLVSLRKRALESGHKSLVGLSNCQFYKLSKRKRLLLFQVFGSSFPAQRKDT